MSSNLSKISQSEGSKMRKQQFIFVILLFFAIIVFADATAYIVRNTCNMKFSPIRISLIPIMFALILDMVDLRDYLYRPK